jgi:hypothetical protein
VKDNVNYGALLVMNLSYVSRELVHAFVSQLYVMHYGCSVSNERCLEF